MPDYEDRIEFVNALTDTRSGQILAERLQVEVVPTSCFFDGRGNVLSTYPGPLTEEQMRERLNALAEW